MIDIQELTSRILAIRRGELPASAVTDDELREALAQQRANFTAPQKKDSPKKTDIANSLDFSSLSFDIPPKP